MKKILLIEDSIDSQLLVRRALDKKFDLTVCQSIGEARHTLENAQFDLILLDLTLPDGDGMAFCSELNKKGTIENTPIIMLTAKTEIEDKVEGLNLGADDYISKPFHSKELMARIESVLRRKDSSHNETHLQVGSLHIDLVEQKAYLRVGDDKSRQMDLTPIEFKILLYLARSEGQPVTRENLFQTVWGPNVHLSQRNIDTHICKLRHKLPSEEFEIKSCRGRGYQFQDRIKKRPTSAMGNLDYVLPSRTLG